MTPTGIRQALASALVLGTAGVAAACASTPPQAGGSSSTPPASPRAAAHGSLPVASPSPVSTPSAQATGCASAALKVVVNVSQAGGAAGSVYYPINFTNTGGSACTLYGYPGVSFVSGRGGQQIGRPASRNPAGPPVMVTLGAGKTAHATVQVAEAGNYPQSTCKPVTVHWLKVYPPNQYAPVYAHFTAQACSATLHGGTQLSIYAMRPGAGRRGQAP